MEAAEKGSPPISRVLSSISGKNRKHRAVIPLGGALPHRSSSLPGSDASHADAPLFGLAPDGVYRADAVTGAAVGSYPPEPGSGRKRDKHAPHRFTLA